MFSFKMTHYVKPTADGHYHVQNVVHGLQGQHHVHTKASFHRWLKPSYDVVMLDSGPCYCDLQPGDVKEYDGKTWHNPVFADPVISAPEPKPRQPEQASLF